MPERPNISFLLNKPPDEIISWFQSKGFAVSWNWRDVWKEKHQQAFTVAKATNMDVLKTIRDEVDRAISEGITVREFQKELEPTLKKLGWWGRQEVVDQQTGEVLEVQLGSPWRLKNIYRTNTQTAYARGRYQHQVETADRRPWWMYDAVGDANTRPSHAEMDGTVLPADDDWWDANYPPNGWGCRCSVRTLSDRQLEERGLRPTESAPDIAEEGWDYNPGKTTFEPDLAAYPEDLGEQFRRAQQRYQPIDPGEE